MSDRVEELIRRLRDSIPERYNRDFAVIGLDYTERIIREWDADQIALIDPSELREAFVAGAIAPECNSHGMGWDDFAIKVRTARAMAEAARRYPEGGKE